MDSAHTFVRHALATLAYRAEKVIRDFPDDAKGRRFAPETRTPIEILSHLGDLMVLAEGMAQGRRIWAPAAITTWDAACDSFFEKLAAADAAIVAELPDSVRWEIIVQAPIADALTHVGQLAMLRGMAGAPLHPESFGRADIRVGRVGRDQTPAVAPFDGDASSPGRRGPWTGRWIGRAEG
jgi:hypothetical protein